MRTYTNTINTINNIHPYINNNLTPTTTVSQVISLCRLWRKHSYERHPREAEYLSFDKLGRLVQMPPREVKKVLRGRTHAHLTWLLLPPHHFYDRGQCSRCLIFTPARLLRRGGLCPLCFKEKYPDA